MYFNMGRYLINIYLLHNSSQLRPSISINHSVSINHKLRLDIENSSSDISNDYTDSTFPLVSIFIPSTMCTELWITYTCSHLHDPPLRTLYNVYACPHWEIRNNGGDELKPGSSDCISVESMEKMYGHDCRDCCRESSRERERKEKEKEDKKDGQNSSKGENSESSRNPSK